MDPELPLRIVIVHPPNGVNFCLQKGAKELVHIIQSDGRSIRFEFVVRVRQQRDGVFNFLGPFAQGRPSDRFVYVNSGRRAAQPDSCWDRRAKVKLLDISPSMVKDVLASPDLIVEATISGVAEDGGPCCASVPLLKHWEAKAR